MNIFSDFLESQGFILSEGTGNPELFERRGVLAYYTVSEFVFWRKDTNTTLKISTASPTACIKAAIEAF